ncbi:MAG TPA: copper chaperone PCu(A)C [Methylophilaceae bacterium]|nr:copper chaperone PCu(A)C [Methylophilaceae bacterium]HQC28536.1 copper chaperone PCu(A)C [Methylotenera sp.]
MHVLTLFSRLLTTMLIPSLLMTVFLTAHAETAKPVQIQQAWARATAPGQSVGAAYMTLVHHENITLIAADSNAAGSVEIHSMEMKNGVMKMRMLEELPLKAGKAVKLGPGGLHLMLFDLQKPLKVGEKIELTLCFRDKQGEVTHQTVTLPVKEVAQ